MNPRALVLSAPGSGAGKTVVSIALMRALRDRGVSVRAAKSGPDYIDPGFHAAAIGVDSVNLDAWAMSPQELRSRAMNQDGELLLIEGAMGVLDGAADGTGSVADLAETLGSPVVLILDVAKTGQSTALAPAGLAHLRPQVRIGGVILNRVGSNRHARMATTAVEQAGFRCLGVMPNSPTLKLHERHLGLVQASETNALARFISDAAILANTHIDLAALAEIARPLQSVPDVEGWKPLGQRIAVAQDAAFAFAYSHMLEDWRRAGAELSFFSPLKDEAPEETADAIFLPGGYPELHAERLASARRWHQAMNRAAENSVTIYGECGGYMVLGEALTDAEGQSHPMLGLLPLQTSFAARQRTLGYRQLKARRGVPISGAFRGHEFHYATVVSEDAGLRLFDATDAEGTALPAMGLAAGSVFGSFAHLITAEPG